ncbi:MAG TPA: CAP domain-containing protein, partial [Actinomycetota bacterium]
MKYARTVCTLMIIAMAGAVQGTSRGAGSNPRGAPPGAGSDPAGAPPGAGSDLPLQSGDSASPADTTEESCFVSAINAARSSAALAPLGADGDLLRLARVWSATMAAAGDISHNPNVASLAPPDWSTLGENVGFGPTCDSVVQAFMSSPEHRRNILDPSYSSLGVGVVDGPDGLMYVTEDFMGTGG